jgi:hypothetical protein
MVEPGLKAVEVSRARRNRLYVWMAISAFASGLLVAAFIVHFRSSPVTPQSELPASVSLEPPVIKITKTAIFVGDREVAKTDAIIAGTRIQKIAGLFDELKRIQESRRNAAGLPQHQTVVISAAWDVSAVVLKSAFQTAAFAGFDDVEFATPDGGVIRP